MGNDFAEAENSGSHLVGYFPEPFPLYSCALGQKGRFSSVAMMALEDVGELEGTA